MVQILVLRGSKPLDEWVIVELQGELKSRFGAGFPGKDIGDLHFNKKGNPILIIGHHIIVGKKIKLEKPFIVLKKCDEVTRTNEDIAYDSKHMVKAKITTKLLFTSRPKPIILHVPKKV